MNKLFKCSDCFNRNTYYIIAKSADSAAIKWNQQNPNNMKNACAFKLVSKKVLI